MNATPAEVFAEAQVVRLHAHFGADLMLEGTILSAYILVIIAKYCDALEQGMKDAKVDVQPPQHLTLKSNWESLVRDVRGHSGDSEQMFALILFLVQARLHNHLMTLISETIMDLKKSN